MLVKRSSNLTAVLVAVGPPYTRNWETELLVYWLMQINYIHCYVFVDQDMSRFSYSGQTILINKKTIGCIVVLNDTVWIPNAAINCLFCEAKF